MSNICLREMCTVHGVTIVLEIADSIVTVMIIRQITKCSSPFFVPLNFFVFSSLDHSPCSGIILILQTNPILIHRFH